MDIANTALKVRKRRRLQGLAGLAVAALLALALLLWRMGPAMPQVDRSSLWIDTVQRGTMLHEVRATGTLVPRSFRWLAAATSAQVEQIKVWPGAKVRPDTVLMVLSDPAADDALRNAQAQVAAARAEISAKRASLQSQLLDQRSALAQAEAEHASAQVKEQADAKAAAMQLIPQVQFQQEQIALAQLSNRVGIEHERVASFAGNMRAQLDAAEAVLAQQLSNLQLRQRQVDALQVRAGIDGVLQEVAVQEGAQVAAGTSLARVARPEELLARLQVPEVQAKDVAIGMAASVDTHNGVVEGQVERIDPAVRQGSVQIDVRLRGPLPAGARPDLSVDGRVCIASLANVLSVGRPALAKADATISLFRLGADGVATRVPVELGAASVERVQIRRGLAAGDQVVLSDTSQWDGADRIRVR